MHLPAHRGSLNPTPPFNQWVWKGSPFRIILINLNYVSIVILIDAASQGFLINLSSKIVNLIMCAFFSHREPTERESIFTCRSSFTPYVPPEEKISLQDHIPQSVKEERKKDDGIEYLPGERLLIKLGKQREKKKKQLGVLAATQQNGDQRTVDMDRITQSMSRVLSTF